MSHDEYGLHFWRVTSPHPGEALASAALLNNRHVFKWAVVRHPWDRIVSAFRSKYEGQCNRNRTCFRNEFALPTLADGSDPVQFHEFMESLARLRPSKMDPHFRPAHVLCELNRVAYDYIADLTNATETAFISERLGFNRSFGEVEFEKHAHSRNLSQYYHGRTHLAHKCTQATVELAQSIYGVDAQLLGYSFAEPARCCLTHGVTHVNPLSDEDVGRN